MTPEQIQRLRELEAKVGPPGSYGRNRALDFYREALRETGPELLDDWERMRAENQRLKETLAGFVESYTNDSRFDDP